MKVSVAGHTATGKVEHAIFGKWSYQGGNKSWCGVTLSGCDSRQTADVEVTCKRCIKSTPTFTTEERSTAFEVVQAYRAGFDSTSNPAWLMRIYALSEVVPGWTGTPIELAEIILSAGKQE